PTGAQVRSQVELATGVAVLAVSDALAVDPDVVGGLHAFELDEGGPARPAVRKLEGRPILSDRVVARGRVRVVTSGSGLFVPAVLASPGQHGVRADRVVVAVQL